MSEPVRLPWDVFAALENAVKAHPEQRVSQVIVNALGSDPFYVEDEDAARRLWDYAAKGSRA